MKIFFPFLLLLAFGVDAVGQGVGIGTNAPQSSTLLDISSTNKGFLLPRMGTAQRNAISSPAKGLLVYDNNEGLYQYNGSTWVQVGNGGGVGFLLPYSHTSASNSALFTVANTGQAGSIMGRSLLQGTTGVSGTGTGTGSYGLAGINTGSLGTGATGIAIDNSAVYAVTTGQGVALRGNSPSGYALVVNGPIKFGGNSMGAATGKVLTSIDANGNARWENAALELIAFRMEDPTFGFNEFSHGLTHKIHFWDEKYDLGNDAQTTPADVALTPSMSTFVVPVTGAYAFNFSLKFDFVGLENPYWDYLGAKIMLDRGGIISTLHTAEQTFDPTQNRGFNLRGGCQKRLLAGDKIYMTLRQTNTLAAGSRLTSLDGETWFAGYLVSAE